VFVAFKKACFLSFLSFYLSTPSRSRLSPLNRLALLISGVISLGYLGICPNLFFVFRRYQRPFLTDFHRFSGKLYRIYPLCRAGISLLYFIAIIIIPRD